MKLPLHIKELPNDPDCDYAIMDADGRFVVFNNSLTTLELLVALANAHTAQPGPPREDGVWDVRIKRQHVGMPDYDCLIERSGGTNATILDGMLVFDDEILCHRKHEPLEVKHG